MHNSDKKLLTIQVIIPIFNEEESIPILIKELAKERDYCQDKFENYEISFCFVNDGSTDNSLNLLKFFLTDLRNSKIINLSRNFGHQGALAAGFSRVTSDYVVVMDADLQDPPNLIRKFIKKIDISGKVDVIHAVRIKRKGESIFKKLSASLFYKIFNYLSPFKSTENSGDCKLYSKRIIDLFNKHSGKDLYFRGMSDFLGYSHQRITYTRENREWGTTKYPLSKMMALATKAVLNFSEKPLSFLGKIYLRSSLIIFLVVLGISFLEKLNNGAVKGWTSLVFIISTFNILQGIFLYIISVYIAKITRETSAFPVFLIDEEFISSKF